ncbi:MAG: TetR/AcrR family transcriptional regulator [Candidatus Nanopelagicales bacterium]
MTDRRAVLLETAARVLAKDPAATLGEIAAAAGVGRTTLHRAFPTREDLLRTLALDALGRVRSAIDAAAPPDRPAPQALQAVAEAVLPIADEMRFLDAGPEVWDLPEMRDAWWTVAESLSELVDRGKRDGDLRPDVPTEVVVDAFVGALWGVADGIHEGRVAPARAARHLTDLLLRGVAR